MWFFSGEIPSAPVCCLVVVFTANMPSETADRNLRGLISDYIVPAIVE